MGVGELSARVRPTGLVLAAMAGVLCLLRVSAPPSAEEDALGVLRADSVVDAQTLLNRAERGDARASFLLGTRYASGRAGVQDDSEAVRWFKQAAEAGLAEAQYNLGIMYASGRGVPRDMSQAAYWYEEAAKQGIGAAQFNVGTMYSVGAGVERNERIAADWLQRAADKGLPEAEFNLGVLYEHGRGVRVDASTAMELFSRAAKKGFAPAVDRLASLQQKLSGGGEAVPAGGLGGADQASMPRASAPARSNDWVLTLNPQHFTLQLISHKEEDKTRAFIVERHIENQGGYFVSKQREATWYSVIYGVFPSHADAEAAARALPASLRDLEPWVRNLGMIQRTIVR